MELILLNAENTLLYSVCGALPVKNEYLTRISLKGGESVQFTHLVSGQTFSFVEEKGFLCSPSPHFKVWQGEGYVFLYVKGEPYGAGKWIANRYLPPLGDFPITKKQEGENGHTLYTFCKAEDELTPFSPNAYALFSPKNELLFYGTGLEITLTEKTFTVVRVFPTHRAHKTVTVFNASTGGILSYSAHPTRWKNPVQIPHVLTPVLFMEEVFLRAHPEDFLSRALLPRVKDFFAFFGDFSCALPWGEGQVLLFRPNGGVARVIFSLREGLICDVEMEE